MSSQNNMAKESYPYKIIWSGYALSSPLKIFKSCTTPMTSQAIVSYFWCSQTFSTFTQYVSVSHGYITIGGIKYGGCGEDKKKEIVSHQVGVLMGYGDTHKQISMRGVGIAMQRMH